MNVYSIYKSVMAKRLNTFILCIFALFYTVYKYFEYTHNNCIIHSNFADHQTAVSDR